MADQGAGDDVGREVHNRMVAFLNDFISQATLEAINVDGIGADTDAAHPLPDYQSQVASMLQGDTSTLFVDFSHLMQHDAELAEVCVMTYYAPLTASYTEIMMMCDLVWND